MSAVEPTFEQVAADVNPWTLAAKLNLQRWDLTGDQRHINGANYAELGNAWRAEQQRVQDEANRKQRQEGQTRERRSGHGRAE